MKHFKRSTLTVVAGAVLIAVTAVATASSASPTQRTNRFERIVGAHNYANFKPGLLRADRQVRVIVELDGDTVGKRSAQEKSQGRSLSKDAKAALRAEVQRSQAPVEDKIRQVGGNVLDSYQAVFNGVAGVVRQSDVSALATMPGVRAVHQMRTFTLENAAGATYIGAPATWGATSGLTGAGVKVAVIDTGVDYWHADFGGSGDSADFEGNDSTIITDDPFPTAKVIGGYDFVGDAYDANSDDPAINTPNPDPDPVDCNGHGTHVAGTAAGFGVTGGATFPGPYGSTTVSGNTWDVAPGVAPQGLILAYRVFGCDGSASEEVIVAALEQAYDDGADVVNMSLGSPFGLETEPSAVASNTLSENGVTVVTSAGNSGSSAYIVGSPSVASRAISVAAIDASQPAYPGAVISGSGLSASVQTQNNNKGVLPASGVIKVLKTGGVISLGCDAADYAGSTGKIVVALRGVCPRVDRATFGQAAGAIAVILVNNAAGVPPYEGPIPGVTIAFLGAPGSSASQFLAADGSTVSLAANTIANAGYGRLASFSSGGPRTGDSALKPDVIAPGVSVVSAGVGTGTGPATISGTSMAAPMTSGAAALVVQARPTWTPEQVKAALMGTANATSAIAGYNPRTGGAGVIDTLKATSTLAIATAGNGLGNLSFGYEPLGAAYSETLPFTLRNTSSSAITYDLVAAFAGGAFGAEITFASPQVTVTAGGTQTVNVTIALDAAEVAALPSAETSNFGTLVTVRGAVTATPTATPAGVYSLRVPFLLAPRGLSDITAATVDKSSTSNDPVFTSTVFLKNAGVHAGSADVYQWGIEDKADAPQMGSSLDIRSVGVQSLPGEYFDAPGDTALVFAVNTFGRWSNPSTIEVDIPVDTDGDGDANVFVVGVDLGAITTGDFDGRYVSAIIDAETGALIDLWIATAPMNGSTMLLPALSGADLGVASGHSITYGAATFSIYDGTLADVVGEAEYNPFTPSLENGGYFTIPSGDAGEVEMQYNRVGVAHEKALGWMIVTLDDANGAAQADLLRIVPPKSKSKKEKGQASAPTVAPAAAGSSADRGNAVPSAPKGGASSSADAGGTSSGADKGDASNSAGKGGTSKGADKSGASNGADKGKKLGLAKH